MASKSETGHAVNAANFSRMIQCCVTMGAAYTPPDVVISLVNLQAAETSIKDSLATFNEKAAPWMVAVNERELAIAPLSKLLTRVKNLVNACDVSQEFKDDVKSIVKEIQGVRAKAKIVAEPGDPNLPTSDTVKNISASQMGYDNRLLNYDRLIQLLKVEPKYTPVETELEITTLEDLRDKLETKNAAVAAKTPAVDNARIDRDAKMYNGPKAGNELASKIKAYMKAKYGGNSKEYHNVAKYPYKG